MKLLNISSAKDFLRCETYAKYLHDDLRAPLGKGSEALLVGTIWHKMMEHYIIRRDMSQLMSIASLELAGVADIGKRDSALRILEQLYEALPHWVIPADWQVYAAEMELRSFLPNHNTELVGKLDALVQWNGFWWHVQHKTLGGNVPVNVYCDYMARDWHECGYQYLAESHGFTPYGGTALIVARKAFGKQPARILHFYIERPATVVDKAVHDLGKIATRWEEAQQRNSYLQNRDSCINPYRNATCAYIGVCNGLVSLADDSKFGNVEPRYVLPSSEPGSSPSPSYPAGMVHLQGETQ